jgi:hypothetical protein
MDDVSTAEPPTDLPTVDDHLIVDPVVMILAAIADVAPEAAARLAGVDHHVDLWTELQLDSMDHLAVMERLSAQSGKRIEERDYPRLTTVDALRRFITGE